MRTKALLLTAALSAAGVATSMAQAVYSVNAVGYVNTVCHPGFTLISNPLTATDNTLAGLFGGGKVPINTVVYKYNGTGFDINTYTDDEIFAPNPNQTVVPGEGVFIKNPTAADITITFVGEVVQNVGTTKVTVDLPKGLAIRSSKVPQAGTATDLGLVGQEGDTLYQYVNTGVPATSAYKISTVQDGEWGPALGSLKVGEAFFYKGVNAATWTRDFSVNSQ
jgi:hypothetical protein